MPPRKQPPADRASWLENRLFGTTGRWRRAARAERRLDAGGGLDQACEAAAGAYESCADEIDRLLVAALDVPAPAGAADALAAVLDGWEAQAEGYGPGAGEQAGWRAGQRVVDAVRAFLASRETDHLAAARWHLERLDEERRACREKSPNPRQKSRP